MVASRACSCGDGSVVLAHNRRADQVGRADEPGRVDQADVAGLRRLAAPINKHLGDGDGLSEDPAGNANRAVEAR
ncbi:hypothetical protein [Dactylosporangium sp. CA-233914]|uniref:hypothetical protein n=1 Tax=Dactylosporangium sp. CA-233914 TaxID=3239934 RepID=UPI003D942865